MDARTGRWPLVSTLTLGTFALMFALGIVRSPEEAVRASLAGLGLWWNQVFPGMMPPLVLAELLAALGVLRGLAVLFEPAARALFRVPGAAGWAIAFGWTAGIPAGARETSRLQEQGLIGRRDAETVLILAHMPNLFLVVLVVGTGFLQSPELGWTIAGGLWLSALLAGWLWSLGGRSRQYGAEGNRPETGRGTSLSALLRRARQAMQEARAADGRPFGKMLADGVSGAVTLLFALGGLMIMSSVAISLIRQALPGTDAWLAVSGLVDMQLGAYESSRSPLFAAAPAAMAALLAAWLAWSGWSGLLQARAAYGTKTPFPWAAFIAGRLLHAALAILCTYPLARWRLGAGANGSASLGRETAATAGEAGGVWMADGWSEAGHRWSGGEWQVFGWFGNGETGNEGWGTDWLPWGEMGLAPLGCLAVFAALALLAALIRPKPPHPGAGRDQKPESPESPTHGV